MQKVKHNFLKRAKKRLLAGILAATMAFTIVPTNVFAVEGADGQMSDSQTSEIQNAETPKAETPKEETPKEETPNAETPKEETPAAEPAALTATPFAAVATWKDVAANAAVDTDYSVVDKTYTIKTATGLAWVMNQVNTGKEKFAGKTVVLAGDIVLTSGLVTDYDTGTIKADNSWTPIGNTTLNSFAGTFDGAGHTVSGVKINKTYSFQGLFGYIARGATVKNVGVIDTDITAVSQVGGVVGRNEGTVTNCYNTGTVTGTGANVGGVIGFAYGGKVTNCYNTGTVTGTGANVGGVIGRNNVTATNCYNTGEVTGTDTCVGGVIGFTSGGSVTNCYNIGAINGAGSVGGVIGAGTGTVEKCYYMNEIVKNGIGGVADDDAKTKGMAAADMKLPAFVDTLNKNLDTLADGALYTWKAVASGYPTFTDVPWVSKTLNTWAEVAANVKTDGTDYEWNADTTVVTIKTATGLAWFANEVSVNGDNFAGKTVALAGDINLDIGLVKDYSKNITAKNSWIPIGNSATNNFAGTFDGAGHTVSGVKIKNTATYQGLFGVADSTATVKNVGVINSTITGNIYVGGVVGENYGTVINCYNIGAVTGTGNYVGGVVGENGGTVTNCYNTGAVTGTDAGGVVGYNDNGTVENCYYMNDIVKNGIGGVTDVPANTKGMPDADMKVAAFVDTLNTNLDAIKDPALYTWKAVASSYPTFTDVPWVAKTPNTWAEVAANVKTDGTDYEWNTDNTVVTIKTPTGLAWFANQVNTGAVDFTGKTVELANNIDLNPADELVKDYSKNITETNSWTSIGTETETEINNFVGTFDGKNHTVSGVKINKTDEGQGLFGIITASATVKNVGVINSTITTKWYAGGVVAINEGTVINCYNAGTLSDTSDAGGVVGYNSDGATVKNCYNTGTVTGTSHLGAVVGFNDKGTVTNCYNTGTVNGTGNLIGGVVGVDTGTITNCYYRKVDGLFGIGGTTPDDPTKTLGMSDANMKDGTLLTNLNTNLDAIKDTALYTWKAVASSYPTFTDTLWAPKAIPTAANFTFTAPTTLVYDGTVKTAKVEVKSGITGMGAITVKYYDKDGVKLKSAAKDAGTYTVKIDVAKGANYAAATDLTDSSWTFTITAEKPVTPSKPVDPSKPESSTSSTASGTSSTTKPATPSTGDSSPLGAMAGMMLLGLAGIVGLVWKKKQDR